MDDKLFKLYDGFEFDPCVAVEAGGHEAVLEESLKGDDVINHWAVFGHLSSGGRETLADFDSRADAEAFCAKLLNRFEFLNFEKTLD